MTESQYTEIGRTVAIWRYPVKSMLGENLSAADITARGMLGDRAYAVIDAATGKIASAKHPKKWGRLFDCQAHWAAEPHSNNTSASVRVTLPDGRAIPAGSAELDGQLSALLGREIRVTSVPPAGATLEQYWTDIPGQARQNEVTNEALPEGTFFDGALIHVMTTATLDALRKEYPLGRFEIRRFRPNLVISHRTEETGFVENAWIGRTLSIGSKLTLKIIGPCARCVMTTLPQGDLPEDPGILRTAVKHNQSAVGVYATVVRPGRVFRGDQIILASSSN